MDILPSALEPTKLKRKGGKNVGKLLLDEKPLIVLPALAIAIGLNESIFVQQLHYWIERSDKKHEGYTWIYNTVKEWQEQFPFWSEKTLRRIIDNLEKKGIVISSNFNKSKIDKTKWYRVNYELLEKISSGEHSNDYLESPSGQVDHSIDQTGIPCGQVDHSMWSECPIEVVNLTTPIPEITTESSSERKREKEEEAPVQESKMNPFRFFEENGFGVIGGHMSEKIGSWCDDLSSELVLEAMKLAVERSVKKWSYVESILRDWVDKNIQTVEQVNAALKAFKEQQLKQRNSKSQNGYKPKRTELLPEWFEEKSVPESKDPAPLEDVNAKKKALEERLKKYKKDPSDDSTP
jgi:DnaD/phage-associated family protein